MSIGRCIPEWSTQVCYPRLIWSTIGSDSSGAALGLLLLQPALDALELSQQVGDLLLVVVRLLDQLIDRLADRIVEIAHHRVGCKAPGLGGVVQLDDAGRDADCR